LLVESGEFLPWQCHDDSTIIDIAVTSNTVSMCLVVCVVRTTMMRCPSLRCRSCGTSMEKPAHRWLVGVGVPAWEVPRLPSQIIRDPHHVDVADQSWGLSVNSLSSL